MNDLGIILIVMAIFIMLLGILIKHLKMYKIIAGYNTMTKEEKENFDIEKFAILMRNVFLIIGLAIILIALLTMWTKLETIGIIVTIIVVFTGLFYLISKGNKLRNS